MARILALSSWVAAGHVGLSAATPALQRLGHEAMALPTIVLSNHKAWPACAGAPIPPGQLSAMLGALDANGWLAGLSALLVGYLPTADHAAFAAEAIGTARARSPDLRVVVDPILGDDPKGLYLPEPAAEALAATVAPLADILTPNRFELSWLAGRPIRDEADAAAAAAAALAAPLVLVTLAAFRRRRHRLPRRLGRGRRAAPRRAAARRPPWRRRRLRRADRRGAGAVRRDRETGRAGRGEPRRGASAHRRRRLAFPGGGIRRRIGAHAVPESSEAPHIRASGESAGGCTVERRYRYILSVIAAALAGHVAGALATGAIMENGSVSGALMSPARLVVAILACAALPRIHLALPAIVEDIAALLWLSLFSAAAWKLALGAAAPWGVAVMVGAIFAAVALFVYRLAAEWGRDEHD
jgi:hypothetical protein